MEKNHIVLLLGGNLGDTRGYLRNALALLEHQLGFITHNSYFYHSPSWGFSSHDFINMALIIETDKTAQECLVITQDAEEELGRVREENEGEYHDRVVDIDIIFYNDLILESNDLVIPHPKMQERNFVLQPLSEMIPDFIHPLLKKSVLELANNCTDPQKATRLNESV